jgi:hypothetical protein
MQIYIELFLEMKMLHARLISPEDRVFDIRTLLKFAADEARNRYGLVCIS